MKKLGGMIGECLLPSDGFEAAGKAGKMSLSPQVQAKHANDSAHP